MERPFEVFEYKVEVLTRLLSELPQVSPELVERKLHSTYFRDYFSKLGARTIVVERDYVDRDYLEDFAAYYVRCFGDYKRKCARLHFFTTTFSHDQFDRLLQGDTTELSVETLQGTYLGFVVVKPLPKTIIGRTCISTYPQFEQNNGGNHIRRFFPTTRVYNANLFGIPLHVDTVAFQEQDSVVAACATSALWSAFHCTARLFEHYVPSPVEITKAASLQASLDTRALPNAGLTLPQMAGAIRSLPLEPYLVAARDPNILRATVYAYLRGGVPVLLAIELLGIKDGTETAVGHHAVAIMGFDLGSHRLSLHPKTPLLLASDFISKIYAHDDQVGPFARMEIDKDEIDRFQASGLRRRWARNVEDIVGENSTTIRQGKCGSGEYARSAIP